MFKSKGLRSQPIASYSVEPRDVQMKIMRTHMAAMAGEISNLRTLLEVGFTRVAAGQQQTCEHVDEAFQRLAGQLSIREGCKPAPIPVMPPHPATMAGGAEREQA